MSEKADSASSATSLGPALDLTPEQLDQAAQVTPTDVAIARATWNRDAPAKLRELLDTETEKGD